MFVSAPGKFRIKVDRDRYECMFSKFMDGMNVCLCSEEITSQIVRYEYLEEYMLYVSSNNRMFSRRKRQKLKIEIICWK